jgi:hypothetical protein
LNIEKFVFDTYPPGPRSALGGQLDSQRLSFPYAAFSPMLGDRPTGLPTSATGQEPYHKNFRYECQLINPPYDPASTVDINRSYVHFKNFERPNQAITCGNQAPRVKFPKTPLLSPVPQSIDPGQTVDISVGMTSPVDNGNYVSYWGLKKVDGPFMPIAGGTNGNSFYIKIKVNNGWVDGNVTAASIAIQPEQGSGPVCTANSTYFVHTSVTTDGAASVAYEIDSSAGQTAAGFFQSSPTGPVSPSVKGTFVFDQADTKTIDLRFAGPYPYPDNITVLLWVNHSHWYQAKLSCDSN